MSTLERHPLTAREADTICAGLHEQGINVHVRIEDHIAHLHPAGPVDVRDEVTALRAFILRFDTRVCWHAARST